jgi:hypothetical protein
MIRIPLAVGGIAAMAWGLWLVRDDGPERWQSQVTWFIGGVVAHDAIIAPLVVFAGAAVSRVLRPRYRSTVAVGFLVWATVTVAAANVLLPIGGRPDNPSLMNRPYVLAWLAFTGLVLAWVALASRRGQELGRTGEIP